MDDATRGETESFRSRLRRKRSATGRDRGGHGYFGLKLVVFGLQLSLIGLLLSGLLWLVPFGLLVSAGGLLVE